MATIVDCLRESAKSLGLILKLGRFRVSLSVLEGKDVFAILPTGFGNSMCFLRPSAEWFSFLVAIMEDQVKDAVRRGLLAAYIIQHHRQRDLSLKVAIRLVFIGLAV